MISEKLQGALKSLTGKGILTTSDVDSALRELRVALLEADVALPAIQHLLGLVRERAVGEKVLTGVNPGQQVVKIVHDAVLELLGDGGTLNLAVAPPAVVLLCGLQGGGKTTTAGKLAKYLQETQKKKVLLASLDVYRPAAIEQLALLAGQVGADVLVSESTDVATRTKAALALAKKMSADVLLLDTAGRLSVDTDMLAELAAVAKLAKPTATVLVADGQTGQTAVQVAQAFMQTVPLSGLVLTRMDGDTRGGAALSMRFVTGVPILFLGTGEKLTGLEVFRPSGLAGRILGQGDVVALVEKLQAATHTDDAAKLEKKLLSGQALDFSDVKKQLQMLQKMGGMSGMMDLLPGIGAMKNKLANSSMLDPVTVRRQMAVVDSMTPKERKNPLLLNARRRQRIAQGAGVDVSMVNKVVKLQEQLNQMSKLMRSGGLQKMMAMMGKGGPR